MNPSDDACCATLAPVAALANLRSLDTWGCNVADLGPLAGMTGIDAAVHG